MRTAYFELENGQGATYNDYGPRPDYKSNGKHARWNGRPFCDMCGPFRGRYLRPIGRPDTFGQEYRCKGCDCE